MDIKLKKAKKEKEKLDKKSQAIEKVQGHTQFRIPTDSSKPKFEHKLSLTHEFKLRNMNKFFILIYMYKYNYKNNLGGFTIFLKYW